MNTTQTEVARPIAIDSHIRVQFQAGHFNGHFYPTGWRVGIVIGHSRIGTARGAGSPTYDVRLRDGNTITNCAPACVRVK